MMKLLHVRVICWALLSLQMFCKNDLNSNKEEKVKPQKGNSENEVEDEDAVQKVCKASGCSVSIE